MFSTFLSWAWVTLSVLLTLSASSTFDLSIKAAILLGLNSSSFSNSETCLTSLSIFSGFCLSSLIFSNFLFFSSGNGIASGFFFLLSLGALAQRLTFSLFP